MQDIFQYSKGCQVLKELVKQGESDEITGFSDSTSFSIIRPLDNVYLLGGQGIECVEWVKMKEVARVLPSKMRDFVVIEGRMKSETGFVV